MSEENPYRLPSDVKPIHYDLTVKTDLEELIFQGYVKIRCAFIVIFWNICISNPIASLDVKSDTSNIILNVLELELGKA